MTPTEPGETTGTPSRPARTLAAPLLHFDLADELDRLGREPAGHDGDRATVTLATSGSFRLLLMRCRAGAEVGSDELRGAIGIVALSGSAEIAVGDERRGLSTNQLVVVDAVRWRLTAATDAALLLTLGLEDPERGGRDAAAGRGGESGAL
jgi:hypothetical protein